MLGRTGEESGTAAVVGAQETGQGSRYCGIVGSSLVYQIDAFSAAYHFLRQVVFRSLSYKPEGDAARSRESDENDALTLVCFA